MKLMTRRIGCAIVRQETAESHKHRPLDLPQEVLYCAPEFGGVVYRSASLQAGNAYLQKSFPKLDHIESATIVVKTK